MSNISNQLVKDTYNYVLQSDLFTGIVYRIGGSIPINPWFQSGLTISGGFTFSDSPQPGYVLTSDALGNASWQPVSAATGNYLSISGGTLLGNLVVQGSLTANTISATTYYNLPIDPDTYVTGFTLNSNTITLSQNRNDVYSSFTISLSAYTGNTSVSGNYLPLSGGTVTGGTIFQSGLTANTISATTYYGLPSSLSGVTSVGGGYSVLSGISASTIVLYTLSGTNGVDIVQSGNTILLSSPIDILNGGTY
jgi:hypothetical protein